MTANITKTIQEDRERAEKKGIEKGKLEVAQNLLQIGVEIDKIIKATGLVKKK